MLNHHKYSATPIIIIIIKNVFFQMIQSTEVTHVINNFSGKIQIWCRRQQQHQTADILRGRDGLGGCWLEFGSCFSFLVIYHNKSFVFFGNNLLNNITSQASSSFSWMIINCFLQYDSIFFLGSIIYIFNLPSAVCLLSKSKPFKFIVYYDLEQPPTFLSDRLSHKCGGCRYIL